MFGGFEFVILGFLFGAAAVALAIITIVAISELISEYWNDLDEALIVAPEASKELEKIARQKGSKKHKRFAYNKDTKEAVLVESNRIDDELKDEDVVTVDIR